MNNHLPKKFDMILVEYDHGIGTCLAYAPTGMTSVGDRVQTTFGTGTVLERALYYTPDDSLIKVIAGAVTIDRTLFKLRACEYEEVKNDGISEE